MYIPPIWAFDTTKQKLPHIVVLYISKEGITISSGHSSNHWEKWLHLESTKAQTSGLLSKTCISNSQDVGFVSIFKKREYQGNGYIFYSIKYLAIWKNFDFK